MRRRRWWLAAAGTCWACWALASAMLARADASPDLQIADPSARLPVGDSAFEYWDFTARLSTGHHVVARLMITNVGPGEQSAVSIGHVVAEDGRVWSFQDGRTRDRWQISSDRKRLDVGSTHVDFHAPHLFLIHGDRVRLDVAFRPTAGRVPPSGALPADYQLELIAAASPLEGELWLEGMSEPVRVSGRVALVHSWSRRDEGDLAVRRIDTLSLDEFGAYAMLLETPRGIKYHWFSARDSDSGRSIGTSDFEIDLEMAPPETSGRDERYPIPNHLDIRGKHLGGKITLGGLIHEQNPLKVLPQPFRFFVGMTMKPRQVWAESGIDVTLRPGPDVPSLQIQGSGVTLVSYVNPVTHP